MTSKNQHLKTLGPVSAAFVGALKAEGKVVFSLEDTEKLTDKNRREATGFINDLIKREIVARLNAGVYLLLETAQESAQLSNWPLIAKALAGGGNYYISHYAALRIHGMTTHALNEISITLTRRRRAKEINHIRYQFIYSKPECFWGFESKWVSRRNRVNVSDRERTILDGLSRPEYCGGIMEVIRGIWLTQNEVDWDKLTSYAKRFPTKSTVKRLGYILESLGLGTKQLPTLKKIINSTKDYVLLDPQGEKSGKYIRCWRLRLNIDDIESRL